MDCVGLVIMCWVDFWNPKCRKLISQKTGYPQNGCFRAVEFYCRTKILELFVLWQPVLELLSFANRFCCEEIKSSCDCDSYTASIVENVELYIDFNRLVPNTLLFSFFSFDSNP
jgi:hypothetical protein